MRAPHVHHPDQLVIGQHELVSVHLAAVPFAGFAGSMLRFSPGKFPGITAPSRNPLNNPDTSTVRASAETVRLIRLRSIPIATDIPFQKSVIVLGRYYHCTTEKFIVEYPAKWIWARKMRYLSI